MYFPTLDRLKQKAVTINTFGGLKKTGRAKPGEFYHMENLTSRDHPNLMPRPGRAVYAQTPCEGMIAKDGVCYVNQGCFVINGYSVDLGLTPGEKQLVSMGAWVVIFPDKKYINTLDLNDHGSLEAYYTSQGRVMFSLCYADGTDLENLTVSGEAPQDTGYWLDTGAGVLKQYSASVEDWVTVDTTYVRIAAQGIGKQFSVGDGVTISGVAAAALQSLNTTATITARTENDIVIPGILPGEASQDPDQGAVKVSRTLPEMDFVVESENRLWGCRYGPDRDGSIVNELYACKLGDFKNWQCFQGLSTDSYRVSLGADGPFTGAVSYLGQPLFFRENCLHKVYGSYPKEYRLQTTPCRGVQKGSHKSLALVDEVLYYCTNGGICAYDGSLPETVSQKLGNPGYHSAVGGSWQGKYYVSVTDSEGRHLLVYDTQRKLWHREDDVFLTCLCTCGDKLYGGTDKQILVLAGGSSTEQIRWSAQTGPLSPEDPYKRYISRIIPRMLLEPGSRLRIRVRYDGRGGWQTLGTVTGSGLRTFNLPLRTRRCEFLELSLEGVGQAKLYSLTLICEEGSL